MGVDSSKPKKQRKLFRSMPLHRRQHCLAANISKPLRKSLGKRSLALRKGDKVKVMRGKHKGTEAKVSRTNYEKQQVFLEKLMRKKSDGTERPIPLHASNLMIVDVDKSDMRRIGKEKGKLVKGTKQEEKPAQEQAKEFVTVEKGMEQKAGKQNEKKEKKRVKRDGKKGTEKKPKKA